MGLKVIRCDITKIKVDAIVNSAHSDPIYGNGVDRAVYQAAGEEELLEARRLIGKIDWGDVRATRAYKLDAKWIFHAVGPRWEDGKSGEYEMLSSCYRKAFALANEKKCRSIAFPLISTGVYGFPKKIALQIAANEIISYVLDHDIDVFLVLFDRETLNLARRIWNDIEEDLTDEQAKEISKQEYVDSNNFLTTLLKPLNMEEVGDVNPEIKEYYDNIKAVFMHVMDNSIEESFGQRMLKYMDELYEKEIIKKDADFYKRAGISNKTFYRIRDDIKTPFHPSKETVWGVCLALQLDIYNAAQLMKLAKYEIDPKDPKDVELEYCLTNKIYNLIEVNERLDDKGLPLVSCKK